MKDRIKQESLETKTADADFNYDVFNALNLHNPLLGEAYSSFGWNPLGENFSLDLPFIEKYLDNAKYKPEEKMPVFLEKDPRQVHETFTLASKRNKEMLAELKSRFENGEFADFKGVNIEEQVKDVLVFMEMRQKMLDISIGQLKHKNIDAFKAYKNINGINRKLSELLEEAYQKEYKKQLIIQNLIFEAQNRKMNKVFNAKPSELYFDFLEKMSQLLTQKPEFDLLKPLNDLVNTIDKVAGTVENIITPTISAYEPEKQISHTKTESHIPHTKPHNHNNERTQ